MARQTEQSSQAETKVENLEEMFMSTNADKDKAKE